jgi:hypothetical protein
MTLTLTRWKPKMTQNQTEQRGWQRHHGNIRTYYLIIRIPNKPSSEMDWKINLTEMMCNTEAYVVLR